MQRIGIISLILIFASFYVVHGENVIIEKLSDFVVKLPEPIQSIANQSLSLMYNKTIEETGKDVQIDWSSVESFWFSLHAKYQPFYIFMVFYSSVIGSYLFSASIFYIIEKLGLFKRYKIQEDKYNELSNYWICLKNIALNYIFVIIPLILTAYPILYFLNIRYDLPFPSLFEVILHNIIFLFGEDFFEYWGHRMLHHPLLYKRIHKLHHQFTTPFGLTASVAHPIETIVLGMATFFPAFIIRPHLFTFYVWIQVRQIDAVITHSGYDLPSILHFLPFYGGAKFHDYHHVSFNYNFASRFTFIDKWCGTYKEPPALAKDRKEKSN